MKKEEIMEIAKRNNEYIYSSIIKENQIPTTYITRLVKEKKLIKVGRGIYISKYGIEDKYFINSILYSKIIYSGESALFLNALSNKQYPSCNETTVPFGSTAPIIDNYKTIVSRKSTVGLGLTTVKTAFGNNVRTYDKERCICDLFIRPNNYDYEERIYAINEYKKKYLNLKKLYEYAKQLNIYDEVSNVFEVISWN